MKIRRGKYALCQRDAALGTLREIRIPERTLNERFINEFFTSVSQSYTEIKRYGRFYSTK